MSAVPQDQTGLSISAILTRDEQGILSEWMNEGIQAGGSNFNSPAWDEVREMLSEISGTRAQQGFTPSETATFIFSVKRPLFTRIQQELKGQADALAAEIWSATELLDAMGLYTSEVFQKSKEEVIRRQQEEMLELS